MFENYGNLIYLTALSILRVFGVFVYYVNICNRNMSTNSVGFVTKIIGPVLDIKFSLGGLLKIYNAIDITMPDESIVKFLKQ